MANPGVASARPDRLAAHRRATAPATRAMVGALTGLPAAVATWNARPSAFGGKVDGERIAAVAAAATALAQLDAWADRVGDAFRAADRSGADPRAHAVEVVGSSAVCEVGTDGPVAEVVRDGADGRARVVRLALDRLTVGAAPSRWRQLVVDHGLDGRAGPVHLVVHGWGTTTAGATWAGEDTAGLYDRAGLAATVVVVDWDAGQGTDESWWRALGDFRRAEASARDTGDVLADLLTAMAATDPDVPVAVSAHSIGNHVAARALSRMDDPSGRFSVDYLAIQAAIPARAPVDDPQDYGALAGSRVRELTVTVNDDDDALFWYEVQGPDALGDEAVDGDGLTALWERRRRAGLDTRVVDHDSAGGGHLGLRPSDAQPLVRDLVEAMIDRLGHPVPG